jgi:hypothetical protein
MKILRAINGAWNGGTICRWCLAKALLEAAIQCDPDLLFWKPQPADADAPLLTPEKVAADAERILSEHSGTKWQWKPTLSGFSWVEVEEFTPVKPLRYGTIREASERFDCRRCGAMALEPCTVLKGAHTGEPTEPHLPRRRLGEQLIDYLQGQEQMGWQKTTDYQQIRPGDDGYPEDPDPIQEMRDRDEAERRAEHEEWMQQECSRCKHSRRQHMKTDSDQRSICMTAHCRCTCFTNWGLGVEPDPLVEVPQDALLVAIKKRNEAVRGLPVLGEPLALTDADAPVPYSPPQPQWDATHVEAAQKGLKAMEGLVHHLQELLQTPTEPEPEDLWTHLDYLPRHRAEVPLGYVEAEL